MGAAGPFLIAGAGIAGLATALAVAQRGWQVHVYERAAHLLELGAGLQISPNSSRILARLGVLDRLGESASRPHGIRICDAASGRTLAQLPLGSWAESRWKSPYLVAHRADLQAALLAAVREAGAIDVTLGTEVTGAGRAGEGISARLARAGEFSAASGAALVAADGVWSMLRRQIRGQEPDGFSGYVAWRSTLPASAPQARKFDRDLVHVFVHRRFHLVAYPLRRGALVNLVGVVRGDRMAQDWGIAGEPSPLSAAMAGTVTADLVPAAAWTAWPIHEVDGSGPWSSGDGVVLVGDAAHAMSPFSAQGAAMAIEDAATLAASLPPPGAGIAEMVGALRRFEAARKPRIARVARRTRLNRLAWHASGPAALLRNLVLAARGGERLMQDLDWLYGSE